MIPIHLTLKGLYSYQEKQEIDFTRLTRASLFGIFGSVGSGKSSILEAITFALYGKTERLNLSGDNRNYNMMNLKSNELLIQFQFKAGKMPDEYLVTVKGKRNSKRFDDVKSLERLAYRKKNGEFTPVEVAEMEAVLGLSYENFKRTIIIPQGKFQEFLQLGNADRTKMMKELFSLEKFELFYKVAGLESANTEKLNILDGKLQAVAESNRELIPEYQKAISENQKKVSILAKQLSEQRTKKQEYDLLKSLSERLMASKQKFEILDKQKQKYQLLADELQAYEYCLLEFKPLLDSLTEVQGNANKTHKEYTETTLRLKETVQNVSTQKQLLAGLQTEFDKRNELIMQAEELAKVETIVGWKEEIHILDKRINEGSATVEKEEQTLKLVKEQIEISGKELVQLKKEKVDVHELHQIKEWFTKKDDQLKQIKEFDIELKKSEADTESFINAIGEHLAPVISDTFNLTNVDKAIPRIDAEIEALEKQTETLNVKIEHANIQLKLADFADNLLEGDPCPVCGSTHHPQLFNASKSQAVLNTWNSEREAIRTKIKTLIALSKNVSELLVLLKTKQGYSADVSKRKLLVLESIKQHDTNFSWDKSIDKDALNQLFENQKKLEKQITQLEEYRDNIHKQESLHQANLDRFKKAIADFQLKYHRLKGQLQTLRTQIKSIDLNLWEQKAQDAILSEKKRLNDKAIQIEAVFTKNKTQLEQLENNKTKEEEKAKTLYSVLQSHQNDLEQKNKQLTHKLKQSAYEQIEAVHAVLAKNLQVNEQKLALSNYNNEVIKNKQQLADVELELKGRSYNSELHQQLLIDLEQNETSIKELEKQGIEVQKQLTDLQNQLAKKEQWLKEKGQLEERAENIKTLKQLFKGNGFVNYISTVHLQNLCKVANERFFKLTAQKLSLEITSDNNFQVRDFLNDGKVRHVKTLSGGQTFQAALSLALALADSVNKLGDSKENFFFLDEGFGNLDKESLEVVFDTLKSLRNENRIVGVISHVEELQHEIDTHIRVKNDEEKGSFIVLD
jgi:exonuclease SbcC